MAQDSNLTDDPLDNEDDDFQEEDNSHETSDETLQEDASLNVEEDLIEVEGEDGEEDRESIRERRRQERADRKRHQREREDTLRRELSSRDETISQMQSRLDIIERRNTGGELAQIAQAKEQTKKAYQFYKEQIRLGTESQNGAAVAEATEKLMEVRSKAVELDNLEKAHIQQRQRPAPMDPRVADNAKSWADRNKWYDIRGKDQDSRMVMTIDQTLAEEGFNPLTESYWEELDNRVKKYLPHRTIRGNITTTPKSVVAGSGRETNSTRGNTTFKLSAERVKALKEAGKWDDPMERNKMIKQYRSYDKANEGAR